MITDSHCHLYWKGLAQNLPAVLERARAVQVTRMVVVGTQVETSRLSLQLAREHQELFGTAGIHPHDVHEPASDSRAQIAELARDPFCVAVGETGLDYFKGFSDQAEQRNSFHWHLRLACELNQPVIIHCRDAAADTLDCLRQYPGLRGVMHCYSMGPAELPGFLELGLHISFSGLVTYPKNGANREAARAVPLERLLIETDAPFLPPQGFRGQANEPALVAEVLRCVAGARGVSWLELAEITSHNATELFGLRGRK